MRILADHPLVKKCFIFNEQDESYHRFLINNTIKQESYDLYLSMFNTKAMALLGFLSGIKMNWGQEYLKLDGVLRIELINIFKIRLFIKLTTTLLY